MNPILEVLLGNTPLPGPEDEILKKVLNDNLVRMRAMESLISSSAFDAVKNLLPIEKQALLKRIGCAPRPVGSAQWGWRDSLNSNDKVFLASCSVCKNSVHIAVPRPQRVGAFLSKSDVDRSCEELQWFHCGHNEKPDENFIAVFRAEAMRLVA